jgi:hypothetical protein
MSAAPTRLTDDDGRNRHYGHSYSFKDTNLYSSRLNYTGLDGLV